MSENDYSSKWINWTTIPVGAGWAFAVGIIEDAKGKRKVRVAKGKFKAAAQGDLPITQAQKFNLKPADWAQLKTVIEQYIAEMEGGK